jgi:hypothetical protein
MRLREFKGKTIDLGRLRTDISTGHTVGAHLHDVGEMDPTHTVLEMVVGHSQDGYAYAFKIYLLEASVIKIERVKFQWECGGWRGDDKVLKRFPVKFFGAESGGAEVLATYLESSELLSEARTHRRERQLLHS